MGILEPLRSKSGAAEGRSGTVRAARPRLAVAGAHRGITLKNLPIVLILSCLSLGADGGSCSAELESDGRADAWEFGDLPSESPAQPLTCEYLDGGTCWTDLIEEAARCIPSGEVGRFSPDRTECTFSDGTTIEWDGDVERLNPGQTSLSIIQHRILRPSGEACLTIRWLGVAHAAFDIDGQVGILRADSLLTFSMICPNGATYANDVAGTCEDTGLRWLAGGLPGYDVVCHGDRDACDLLVKGGRSGRTEVLATCVF